MGEKPILYSYYRSSCSWRVRAALAFKGIEYEYRAVNLLKGEQRGDEHALTNPMLEVPAFFIEGKMLTQSIAILEFLEEAFPDKKLLPEDKFDRGAVRQIVSAICCDIQPVQNLRMLKYMGIGEKLKHGNHLITEGFKGLEKLLLKTSGEYCVGDQVTFADLCLVPQVYNANRFEVDMTAFPTISKLNSKLLKEEFIITSHPSKMPDDPLNQ